MSQVPALKIDIAMDRLQLEPCEARASGAQDNMQGSRHFCLRICLTTISLLPCLAHNKDIPVFTTFLHDLLGHSAST